MNALAPGSENCLPIGTRLADFEITGVLGEGGFGIVYMAFDHSLQRSVALKEYMPGVLAARASDNSIMVRAERHQETFNVGLKSFINEARFLAQFDHPSLVKVHRFWEQNRTAYTAMQYYDGRTIKDIVTHSPELVTEAWCKKVMKQILDALEMLYTMKILHRDVSPDNIIVQESGDAVLLDFGSARQIIGDRTRGLTVILKPGYAPVEQYAGDASLDQGPYTDIYALAAVMFFAIIKEPPATSIARMVRDPVKPLAERGLPGYSLPFLAAIDKGLAVLAQDRPQTIDAFRALLGIETGGEAPRARPTGPAQRFATLDRLPDAPASASTGPLAANGASAADGAPAKTSLSKSPASSKQDPLAKSSRRPKPDVTDKPAKPVKPAKKGLPPWTGIAASAVVMIAAIGVGVYSLLSKPSDTIMVAPAQPVIPDAAALPPPAAVTPPVVAATAPVEPLGPAGTVGATAPADGAAAAAVTDVLAEPVPEPAPEAAPESFNYKLAIKPWGTIYVDGKEAGVTPPLKKLTLAAGKHKIRIANPGFQDFTVSLDTAKNKSRTIEHDFTAQPK
ncbi:serine/threonine-protein kinase [Massilia aquatica]|uniref:non-specific serine/threonine protein kinase n=1 Tax=Massilia aquatica TaxID=2609000 RepID=A0ABX0MD67_9BURK|nr:serine/threonine-protein kinase [Massilia aquatica]NHZ44319.1 protein kinase [Massilia aquatica]